MTPKISWGVTWKLKSCPKCYTGDLFKEKEETECLQCGYIEIPNVVTTNSRSLPQFGRIRKESNAL